MTMRYWTEDTEELRVIQDKLDRHQLGGKTLEELKRGRNPLTPQRIEQLRKIIDEIVASQPKRGQSPILNMTADDEEQYLKHWSWME